jgi:hypothetical protein
MECVLIHYLVILKVKFDVSTEFFFFLDLQEANMREAS